MILTKQVLNNMLKYSESKISEEATEKELHKKLKCLAIEAEVRKNENLINDAFSILLNLCHLKKK